MPQLILLLKFHPRLRPFFLLVCSPTRRWSGRGDEDGADGRACMLRRAWQRNRGELKTLGICSLHTTLASLPIESALLLVCTTRRIERWRNPDAYERTAGQPKALKTSGHEPTALPVPSCHARAGMLSMGPADRQLGPTPARADCELVTLRRRSHRPRCTPYLRRRWNSQPRVPLCWPHILSGLDGLLLHSVHQGVSCWTVSTASNACACTHYSAHVCLLRCVMRRVAVWKARLPRSALSTSPTCM